MTRQKNNKVQWFDLSNGKWPYIFIILAAIVTFIPTIKYGYSPLDDFMLIVKRLDWLKHSSFYEIFTQGVFKTQGSDYYRPLLVLSFKLDAIIGNGSSAVFHLTNILYHLFATLLLFNLLKQFITKQSAFIFSLLYSVHPLAVHAVAWIPGRNDTLLAIFVFGSALSLINFLNKKHIYWLIIHFLTFISVLLTKESAVLFPFVLIFMMFLLKNKKFDKELFICGCIWIALTFLWFLLKNNAVKTQVDFGLFNFQKIILDSIKATLIYFGKIFFPFNLAVLPNTKDTSIVSGILICAALIYLIIKFGIKDWYIFVFGMLWFFLFLALPMALATFDGIGIHYEHRMYVPLFGFILSFSQIKVKFRYQNLIAALFVLIFSIQTIARNKVYQNSFSFAIHATKESPSSSMAFNMLGSEYNNQGKYKEAIDAYSKAIELDTNKYIALFNRGFAYKNWGMPELALADYNKGLKHDSLNAKAFLDRGNIYFDLGNFELAIADFNKAIEIYPQYSNAHNNRGNAYANLKQFDKALSDYNKAIKFRNTNASAYNNRGNVYAELGDLQKALSDYRMAVKLKPKDADFRKNYEACLKEIQQPSTKVSDRPIEINISDYEQQLLPMAYNYYKQKDYNNALKIFKELAEETKQRNMIHNYFSHQNNVALCLIKLGNVSESQKILWEIIKADPRNEKAYLNLGLLYKTMGLPEKAREMYQKVLDINPDNVKAMKELQKL